MALSDKLLGAVLVSLSFIIFSYYSIWVLFLVRYVENRQYFAFVFILINFDHFAHFCRIHCSPSYNHRVHCLTTFPLRFMLS